MDMVNFVVAVAPPSFLDDGHEHLVDTTSF